MARLVDHLRARGVDVMVADLSVPERPYATLPLRAWRAGRPVRGRFDLWHSFDYGDGYTEPLVAYLSGARAWIYTKKNMGWGSRAWKVRSLLARRIAVQNDRMPSLFFDSVALRSKVRYVPTGIDVESWADAAPTVQWRTQLGIPDDGVLISSVGHVQERKNQLLLVEALDHLPEAHLAIAGRTLDEGYGSRIVARARELDLHDRVHHLGAISDIAGLLRCSDIFALVAHAEGSPVAMLEAMASGLPGVYSSIPGIEERVTDGRDGYLVDPSDARQLADRLGLLARSPELRRAMGAAAQRTIALRGRIEIEAARYESLYLEVIGRRARPLLTQAGPEPGQPGSSTDSSDAP